MNDEDLLAQQFEANRPRLRAVAYRVLGSLAEADDAVQEAWLRLARSDAGEIDNLAGWLTTVVSRVSLDLLRSRASRREDSLDHDQPDWASGAADGLTRMASASAPASASACASPSAYPYPAPPEPEAEVLLADSVGPALQIVLDSLNPSERLAFVLHDVFGLSFEEIGPIVDRSPAAARQLASRARRRVRGGPAEPDVPAHRQREVVAAFLDAARNGRFDTLLSLLDPSVMLRADAVTAAMGAQAEVFGARQVAETFSGRAKAARLAIVDGLAGAVWGKAGAVKVVFAFSLNDGGAIAGIEMLADPAVLAELDIEFL
ncbi:sigma-70 family RNA polymerase sigma factor [Jatrophihabitans telluris]|uniref:Sigma-70 family RNA polymerase sigma factor n=1 Tax=Jatrophihabitans telluris TaxID=2038343 RepID=A0ABY4QXC3_9ACTN|nr:sigma-70 family RNA polymerase sigma factor [Jatrophihabitans telluris]UQX87666.1 sigma-70 family RNA polymerase sigma factor [Jatrophihabitans telluris]